MVGHSFESCKRRPNIDKQNVEVNGNLKEPSKVVQRWVKKASLVETKNDKTENELVEKRVTVEEEEVPSGGKIEQKGVASDSWDHIVLKKLRRVISHAKPTILDKGKAVMEITEHDTDKNMAGRSLNAGFINRSMDRQADNVLRNNQVLRRNGVDIITVNEEIQKTTVNEVQNGILDSGSKLEKSAEVQEVNKRADADEITNECIPDEFQRNVAWSNPVVNAKKSSNQAKEKEKSIYCRSPIKFSRKFSRRKNQLNTENLLKFGEDVQLNFQEKDDSSDANDDQLVSEDDEMDKEEIKVQELPYLTDWGIEDETSTATDGLLQQELSSIQEIGKTSGARAYDSEPEILSFRRESDNYLNSNRSKGGLREIPTFFDD